VIKVMGKGPRGRDVLYIGLTEENIARLEKGLIVSGVDLSLSHDVALFSRGTDEEMTDLVLGPSGMGQTMSRVPFKLYRQHGNEDSTNDK
jgi:hypothetical protein